MEGVQHMIDGCAPKTVIPVHTQNPEEFKKMHGNVILMERGKAVKI
jgi:mRNA degradation ribonuclease J1/J2